MVGARSATCSSRRRKAAVDQAEASDPDQRGVAKAEVYQPSGFKAVTLPILFKAADGAKGLERRLDDLFAAANKAIKDGCNIIILSDRGIMRRTRADPGVAGGGGTASSPDPRRHAGRKWAWCWNPVNRAKCIISPAHRLRLRRHQSVSGLRDD
jgi:hypothetical protein